MQSRIWAVNKNQPISNMQTMEQALSHSVADRRIYLLLLSDFAAIASRAVHRSWESALLSVRLSDRYSPWYCATARS